MTQPHGQAASVPTLDLQDKVAIVTGSSRGIGRAISSRFAQAGARVVVAARASADLDKCVAEINQLSPGSCLGVAADLSLADDCSAVVASALEWAGTVDVLVNNVGSAPAGRLVDLSDDQFLAAWSLKLLASIRLLRLLIPVFEKNKRGRIINIIGAGGREPRPETIAVATTNAAIRALVKGLAPELASAGVTINAISPARVRTDRAIRLAEQTAASRGVPVEEVEREALQAIPTGRLVEPAEIAELALLLASDQVPSMTGAEIVIDGGTTRYM